MISGYVKSMRDKIEHMAMFMPTSGLIICKDEKVLLQKRADDGNWAMHGGGMEPGEEFLDVLKREIKEEINVEPIEPQLFGIYAGKDLYHEYPNGDKVYILNHVFFCEDYKGEIRFNDKEVTEVKWFSIYDLPKNILHVDRKVLEDIKIFIKDKKPIIK